MTMAGKFPFPDFRGAVFPAMVSISSLQSQRQTKPRALSFAIASCIFVSGDRDPGDSRFVPKAGRAAMEDCSIRLSSAVSNRSAVFFASCVFCPFVAFPFPTTDDELGFAVRAGFVSVTE